ncbi:BgtTE-56072 [Blumeria graminis f. sp. tritici]|uniref:BgtTE-56072 n=1 Tax=Blumeria graminis f. sp. tritici TaxID=62690 RepID=A0A9X9MIZ7_BLUGR|nr:BgtTE-56072 [Blumeria graminis f. sp. tritici]
MIFVTSLTFLLVLGDPQVLMNGYHGQSINVAPCNLAQIIYS